MKPRSEFHETRRSAAERALSLIFVTCATHEVEISSIFIEVFHVL